MLQGANVFVVVPAFNERRHISGVIASMPELVDRIIVVDDASTDDTAAIVSCSRDPRVELIRHPQNRGVGAAIATGYRRALAVPGTRNDAFAVMAADGQMDPDDLASVALPVASGASGYVKGDRFRTADVTRVMPRARYAGGRVFSKLTALAVGEPVSDSQCGYTALARWACERIDLDDLWPRFGYPNDLLGQLAVRGIPFQQVGVRAIYADEESKLRAYHLFAIGYVVLRAWGRRVRGERVRTSGRSSSERDRKNGAQKQG